MKNGTIVDDQLQYITPDVQRAISRYTINREDLYITIAGTIGQVGRVPSFFDGHNLTENAAKIVFRGMNPQYLCTALNSDLVQQQFKEKTNQVAQPKLALKRILGAQFPLPPLAEQHRIVAKVNELMALCDRLEGARAERESRRDRLAATSLHRLNQPADTDAPESLREYALFYLNHLPRLTTRPDQIKQLRLTILNLAIRGRLVPQDPNDESASELLKRIHAERVRLGKRAANIHAQSTLPTAAGEPRSAVPEGWSGSDSAACCWGIRRTATRRSPTTRPTAYPYCGSVLAQCGKTESLPKKNIS
jgi:type I restriction enzyme S subunit